MELQEDFWSFVQGEEIALGAVEETDFSNNLFEPKSEASSSSADEPKEIATSLTSRRAIFLGKRERNHEYSKAGGRCSKEKGGKESRWALQLLHNCAEAMESSNIQRAQHLLWVLNDLGCLTGDANQRLAAYGLKALASKLAGSYPAFFSAAVTPKYFYKALLEFDDANPWNQMVYTVTNRVLIDAFEGKDELHVVDIGVSLGTQWPTLIESLATRATGRPTLLRLTIIQDEQLSSVNTSEVTNRLEKFAQVMGLNMQLRLLSLPPESLTRECIKAKETEALAICSHFRLNKISSREGARDDYLKRLHREVSPELMILGETDSDQSSSEFVEVFDEVLAHLWCFLDSSSSAYRDQNSESRQVMEQMLGTAVIRNVMDDSQRCESCASWSRRMKAAAFQEEVLHEEIAETVKMLLKKNDENWDLWSSGNSAVLLWKQQPVTFCSVWRSEMLL